MTPLFEQFGGDKTVTLVVKIFYEKMLTDSSVSKFFVGVDLETLQRKQKWFLTSILMSNSQGTPSYMKRAHHKLVRKQGLNASHFDATVEHLDLAMPEASVDDEPRRELLNAARSLKGAVLGIEEVCE